MFAGFLLPMQADIEIHAQPQNSQRSQQPSSGLPHREEYTQLRKEKHAQVISWFSLIILLHMAAVHCLTNG